jgi:hypothetical protein
MQYWMLNSHSCTKLLHFIVQNSERHWLAHRAAAGLCRAFERNSRKECESKLTLHSLHVKLELAKLKSICRCACPAPHPKAVSDRPTTTPSATSTQCFFPKVPVFSTQICLAIGLFRPKQHRKVRSQQHHNPHSICQLKMRHRRCALAVSVFLD